MSEINSENNSIHWIAPNEYYKCVLFIYLSTYTDLDEPPQKKKCMTNTMMENEIAKQNKEFFEIRGRLKDNTKREDRVAILKFNNQFVPTGNEEVKKIWWIKAEQQKKFNEVILFVDFESSGRYFVLWGAEIMYIVWWRAVFI